MKKLKAARLYLIKQEYQAILSHDESLELYYWYGRVTLNQLIDKLENSNV
jgi:hypothetical protein